MDFAFPDDFATEVLARWDSFCLDARAPPLPPPRICVAFWRTAFFASLEREEGRPLHFVLLLSPDVDVVRDGFGESVLRRAARRASSADCRRDPIARACREPVTPHARALSRVRRPYGAV
jgi:hypothetical protein